MDSEARILEFRTASGELLFSIRLIVKNDDSGTEKQGKQAESGKEGGKATGGKPGNGGSNGYAPMTDAQKRYLFRLLAGDGIEGEAVYAELKKIFHVDNLKMVTKVEASQEIDRRVTAQKGGGVHA